MATTPFAELEGPAKDEMVVSMAALLLEECGQDFSIGQSVRCQPPCKYEDVYLWSPQSHMCPVAPLN